MTRAGQQLETLWQALSDPTRRALLDLLRIRPRTTGELAQEFPTSRFAIMKHLGVLERSGLVVVRRNGRERWNHLNAVPLQLLYDRWVKPYQALWATRMTALKSELEGAEMPEAVAATIEQVELEIEIHAPRERVWKALTEETSFWWPKDFCTSPKAQGFVLEPRLGGKLYEDWGGGEGVIWYEVFAIHAPESLDLRGCMAVPYGPAHTLLHLELTTRGSATLLKVSDSTIGLIHSGSEGTKSEGWRQIFDAGLKRFVEAA